MTEAEAAEMHKLRQQNIELGKACWVLREALDERYRDALDQLTNPSWLDQVQERQRARGHADVHAVLRVA